MGKKSLDCTHGADHSLSKKTKFKKRFSQFLFIANRVSFFLYCVFIPDVTHYMKHFPYIFPYIDRNGKMQIWESSHFSIFQAVTYAGNFSRNSFEEIFYYYFAFLSLFSEICLIAITVAVFFNVILTITLFLFLSTFLKILQ